MGILATYKLYRGYENQYNDWKSNQDSVDSKREVLVKNNKLGSGNSELAQKKARIVADSMLILDNIAQTKAEDVEAVFQTVQIELLAGLTGVSAIPSAVKTLTPKLEKHSANSPFIQKVVSGLKRYEDANLKIGKFKLPLSRLLTAAAAVASAIIYVPMVTDSVKNQIGATRRAKFETMQKELSNINDFAVLTPTQERDVQSVLSSLEKPHSKSEDEVNKFLEFAGDAIDRVNISKSMASVNKLLKDKNTYLAKKGLYDKSLKDNEKHFAEQLNQEELQTAKEDKQLFENIIKNVDLKSQDDLERIEKIINVGYGSLFVGGFLEYLLSDKLIDKLNVKNPILKNALGFGIPLVTYMILNKNLAKVQNSAIKAVRYKNLNELVSDKNNFNLYEDAELNSVEIDKNKDKKQKEGLFDFLKKIKSNIKEYKEYQHCTLPKLKGYMQAKRAVKLSPTQQEEAKLLQRNAFMTISTVDDNNQKFSESIETLSEIALAPIELTSTAVGGFLGNKMASAVNKPKLKGLFTVLGAILAFIPSAAAEVYTTAQQRKALRIASMVSLDELKDHRQFVNYDNKSFKQQIDSAFAFKSNVPSPFIAFQKKFESLSK